MKRRLAFVAAVLLVILGLAGFAWSASALARDGEGSKGLGLSSAGNAQIWTDKSTYRIGDDVKIYFRSSQTGYAVIYDYSADGRSQVVWPADGSPELIVGGRTYSLPQGGSSITASEPLGTDTLVLVVSPVRATFVGSINLSFYIGGPDSRGLTVGSAGYGPSDGSFAAQCSFNVLPAAPNVSVHWRSSGAGSALVLGGLLLLLAGAAVLMP